jgi:hypothetical protein
MISEETLNILKAKKWKYILGVRMKKVKVVSEKVLGRGGRYEEVVGSRRNSNDPSPLKVKEVYEEKKRYLVCLNEEQAKKDRHDRETIIENLRRKLKQGDKSLVGNKGYRRYLKVPGGKEKLHFEIDEEKVKAASRYDGKWVLTTNTDLSAKETALKYKQLWMVEAMFRSMKSLLETRPIYHKCDETIRGHVFCSFLALKLRKEMEDRLENRGIRLEWDDIIQDLDNFMEFEIQVNKKNYLLRNETSGSIGKVAQACGVSLPPSIRLVGAGS